MYSVTRLDPDTAVAYQALAPRHVRHLLRRLGELPRLHAVGGGVLGRPLALGLAVRLPDGRARLLSLIVHPSHRRIGVGTAVLRALEEAMADDGATELSFRYTTPVSAPSRPLAFEALFRRAAWEAPETVRWHYRSEGFILDAPMLRAHRALPPEYEICDWVDLGADERDDIARRQRAAPWYPEDLDPFHFERDLDLPTSLALRHRGDVVGWLLTRQSGDEYLDYTCLFVRHDLALLGRGVALLYEALRRHAESVAPRIPRGTWSTSNTHPAMRRFNARRMAQFVSLAEETRVVRKPLSAVVSELTAHSPQLTARGSQLTAHSREPRAIALLSLEECRSVRDAVHASRDHWVARRRTLPFHTLGAASYLDAPAGIPEYERLAARQAPLMRERFGWLHDRLRDALSRVLGEPVVPHPRWAPPGFHVSGAGRGCALPLAPVHCDLQYLFLDAPATGADQTTPISFTLPITLPAGGSGLNTWDLSYDETIGLDPNEVDHVLDTVPMGHHRYREGSLVLYAGHRYHQMAPMRDALPDDERLTLHGHGLRVGGEWQVYW